MKKGIFLILGLVFLGLATGLFFLVRNRLLADGRLAGADSMVSLGKKTEEEVEGDNCQPGSGLVWCESSRRCLREGEELCENKDLTRGWPTYQNRKYGYFFKHPADCFLGPLPEHCLQKPPQERSVDCLCFLNGQNPDQVLLQTFTGLKDNLISADWSITHLESEDFNPPVGTELIGWLEQRFSQLGEIPKQSNMTVASLPAIRVYRPASEGVLPQENIFLLRDNQLFQFSLLNIDEVENKELYYQLLATFRFQD